MTSANRPVGGLVLGTAWFLWSHPFYFGITLVAGHLVNTAAFLAVLRALGLGLTAAVSWFWVWPLLAWAASPAVSLRRSIGMAAGHVAVAIAIAAFSLGVADTGRAQSAPTATNLLETGRLLSAGWRQIYESTFGLRGFHLRLLIEWASVAPVRLEVLVLATTVIATASPLSYLRAPKADDTPRSYRRLILGIAMVPTPIILMSLQPTPYLPSRSLYLPTLGLGVLLAYLVDAGTCLRLPRRMRLWTVAALTCLLT